MDEDLKSSNEVNIQTFLRVRPSKNASGYFKTDDIDPHMLYFNLPESYKSAGDYINNTKLQHRFVFTILVGMIW